MDGWDGLRRSLADPYYSFVPSSEGSRWFGAEGVVLVAMAADRAGGKLQTVQEERRMELVGVRGRETRQSIVFLLKSSSCAQPVWTIQRMMQQNSPAHLVRIGYSGRCERRSRMEGHFCGRILHAPSMGKR